MYKHLLILPDGTELFSGVPGQAAIRQVKVTQCVNTEEELEPGCVCAGLLEAEVLIPGDFSISTGATVTLYRVSQEGDRTLAGSFLLEKPERVGEHLYRITGYDCVSCLDQDLTQWFADLTGWPYTLFSLAQLVCSQCGLALITESIPNGNHPVQRFQATGLTGRQLMHWIAQASCRFCRATPDGKIALDWYTEEPPLQLATGEPVILRTQEQMLLVQGREVSGTWQSGTLHLSSQSLEAQSEAPTLTLTTEEMLPCYSGSMHLADYRVAPVQRVQIRQNREDVGTVYPEEAGEKNTYILQGNPLLCADHADTLRPVAEVIYNILSQVEYTPGTVSISTDLRVQVGQILTVRCSAGPMRFYVMRCIRNGLQDRLEGTGSPTRQCTTAVNGQSYSQLQGKVLELQTDVEGIRAENRDAAGNLVRLSMDVTGLRTQVTHQESADAVLRERMTALEQAAEEITLTIQTTRQQGAEKVVTGMGYSFDDQGLHIRRKGEQMENSLDHTGMYVSRAGEMMLQANKDGVVATDVQVRNYLVIGTHSRLEDYTNEEGKQRTACFRIGG